MIIEVSEVTEPQIHEFLGYWSQRKGESFAPSWKDFDLPSLNPKLIPFVIVADAVYDPASHDVVDFVIRFWGTGQTEWKGYDKTGLRTRDEPQFRGPVGWEEYLLVVKERRPIISRDTVYRDKLGKRVNIEQVQVRAPLSDDGLTVTKVVTLGVWK